MLGIKFDLLKVRLETGPDDFCGNNEIWKTGSLNKWIKDHDVKLKKDLITVKGKYRGSRKRVQLLRDDDLKTIWFENHNQPGMHADREKTIHKICTK